MTSIAEAYDRLTNAYTRSTGQRMSNKQASAWFRLHNYDLESIMAGRAPDPAFARGTSFNDDFAPLPEAQFSRARGVSGRAPQPGVRVMSTGRRKPGPRSHPKKCLTQ